MLLRVAGRRSGRTFELPVGYAEDGEALLVTVGAPDRKRWWRNIAGPTPVGVVLRGRRLEGVATLTRSEASTRVRIELVGVPRA